MKILRHVRMSPEEVERFHKEVYVCARLSHQAIVPIHDCGFLADGRPYITMPIVTGKTLFKVIRAAHRDNDGRLNDDQIRRLVSHVRVVCEAIAYAHEQGVLHRDLKPSNIMVSDYNEVRVLDWGLAQSVTADAEGALAPAEEARSDRSQGSVRGTCVYMAPEQAWGGLDNIDERTDIFALGAVLFEALTGQPPWGWDPREALTAARAGQIIRIPGTARLPAPLVQICERALSISKADRFQSARTFSRALADWLEGLAASRQAQALIAAADQAGEDARALYAESAQEARTAQRLLEAVPISAPESEKHAGWALEEHAQTLQHAAEMKKLHQIQLLNTALTLSNLRTAHERLADIYHRRHHDAEQSGKVREAERFLYLLKEHNQGRYDRYLNGRGWLALRAARPARVQLFRYERRHRRLRPLRFGAQRALPIARASLPIGSYLAELIAADGVRVRVPFEIRRDALTDVSRSLDGLVAPIDVPLPTAIPPGMVYIPAGPVWFGGDMLAMGTPLPERQVWVNGFFIDRYPVTNARYLTFLNALVASGREAEALSHCPRERAAPGVLGAPLYGRDEDGRFLLVADNDGDVWEPDWPAVSLHFESLMAFANWQSVRTGRTHRLPYEVEWVKAARGADRRIHVWGDAPAEPSWCHIARSTRLRRNTPALVHTYPADESPYGVRGLAGNVSDICMDPYTADGPHIQNGRWWPHSEPTGMRPVRGGTWNAHPQRVRIGFRGGIPETSRSSLCGFRLVVPCP